MATTWAIFPVQLGEPGANQHQDDFAVIAGQAPLRADDAGGSLNTAARLPSGTANISSRNDIDYYALGTCTGSVTVAAQPAALGANLDIALTIVDSTGNPVAAAAPATTQQQANEPYPWDDQFVYQAAQVTGMDAAVTTTLPAGRYYAAVDGGGARAGGAGNPVTDYDDYASLGGYTLTVAGCTAAEAAVPGPTTMNVTFTAAGLSTTWTAPTDDGGSDLLGFDVTLDGGAPVRVSPDVTSYAWPDVTTGSHTVSVTAVNETGAGQAATSSVRRSLPGAPVLFSTGISTHPNAPDPSVLYFDINWLPPTDDGGSPVLSYRVEYEIRPGVWQLVRELSSDGTYSVNNLGVSADAGLDAQPPPRDRRQRGGRKRAARRDRPDPRPADALRCRGHDRHPRQARAHPARRLDRPVRRRQPDPRHPRRLRDPRRELLARRVPGHTTSTTSPPACTPSPSPTSPPASTSSPSRPTTSTARDDS